MIKKLQNSNAILQQMRGRWLGGMKLIDGRALTVAVNAVSTGKVETVLWPKNGREVDIRFHSRISSNSDGVDLIDEDGSDTLTGTVSDNEVHGYASFGAEHVKGEIALVQVNEGLSGNAAFDALGQRGFLGPEAFHELASAALKANDMQGALKWLRLGKQAKPGFPDALLFATDLAPIRRTREFKQLFEDPVASYAELSQATHSIKIERSVHIPMRDGIKLLADIYRPDEAERYPVILIRSPYGRGTDIPPDDVAHYAARGYVVVIEAVRGTDGSEGEFQPWLNERKDGYDSIDWVSKQQWSIAKVGMLGLSYLGQAQWAAAVEAHPALKCIIPEVSGTDHMLDTPYDHGILRLELLGWSRNFVPIPKGSFSRPPLDDDLLIGLPLSAIDTAYTGHALPVWQRFLEFDRASAWSSANFLRDLTTVKIPVLNISGWWDSEANSTQTNYLAMRGLARDNQWLIYDPWAHVWNQSTKFRDMEYGPIAKIDFKSLSVRWFDQWLKGKAVDFEKVSKAQIFVTGSNRWVNLPDWPAPSAREKVFYLSAVADSCSAAVKKLGSEPTTDCSDSDLYTYDPADVKTGGSGVLPDDSTALHLRSAGRDMLVYETEPFESATIITSPGSLDLWFSTSAHDADFFVLIYDRDAYNVARAVAGPGKMRMKYMTGWDNPQVLSPGKLYHQPIEVRPFAHEFAKGHRLGIVLRSEWFPGYERNLNTGEPTKDATRIEIGEQRVFHDPTHASSLHLWQIQAK